MPDGLFFLAMEWYYDNMEWIDENWNDKLFGGLGYKITYGMKLMKPNKNQENSDSFHHRHHSTFTQARTWGHIVFG